MSYNASNIHIYMLTVINEPEVGLLYSYTWGKIVLSCARYYQIGETWVLIL